VVWADGSVHWLQSQTQFFYGADGQAELGMSVDITERKLVEEALSNLSRKLLEAQEQERAWIERELHDDINVGNRTRTAPTESF